jgi:AcrR family transcriptional regulator
MSASPKEQAVNRKQNILMAAERLFARHGYHGVSIRDIAEEAGVQFALVGYYYGSKLQLYYQIFQERSGYINQRLEKLGQILQKPRSRQSLNEIIEAFVEPVLQLAAHSDGKNFLRMISRGMSDQLEEDEQIIRDMFDPLAHAFIEALASVLPQASRGTVAWCYQFALGALLHHVTDRRVERLSNHENRHDDYETSRPLLVKFIVHGMRGVCGPASAAAPAAKTAKRTKAAKTAK